MIIIFGILSLLQLTIIPGLIITRLVKIQGFFQNLILTLGLSPIVNYLFVLIMTTLGIYNRISMFIFVGIEIVTLFVVLIPVFKDHAFISKVKMFSKNFIKDYFEDEIIDHEKGKKVIKLMVFIFALGMLLFYLVHYASQYSSVFTAWDAVVSWNRWAVDWFGNHFPYGSQHYPQMIPVNLSMIYQLIGDERVQFFAKYFMGWMEVFILLDIFILGVIERKMHYFIAVVITGWLQYVLGSQGSGYVDTPVSFWALLSITCLVFAKNYKEQTRYIILGALFAAGSAVTKQAGIWVAITYPLLLFLLNREKTLSVKISTYLYIGLIYLVIIVPWYGYIQYQITFGHNSSEIPYVTTLASHGKSFLETIISASKLLCNHFSKSLIVGVIEFLLLFTLTVYSIFDKWSRKIVGFIILPMFLAWLFFFSYDIRNINIIVPFMGIAVGIGIDKLIFRTYTTIKVLSLRLEGKYKSSKIVGVFSKIGSIFKPIKRVSFLFPMFAIFVIFPLLLVIILPNKYTDSYLLTKSLDAQRKMGSVPFNQKLYDFLSDNVIEGKILTDYQYVGYLPELREYYEYGFPNSEIFIQQFGDPKNEFALISLSNMSPEVRQFLDELVKRNKIKIMFDYGDYVMYSTCRGPC